MQYNINACLILQMLPSAEQKVLLRKGTLEILQLPATPARPQKL